MEWDLEAPKTSRHGLSSRLGSPSFEFTSLLEAFSSDDARPFLACNLTSPRPAEKSPALTNSFLVVQTTVLQLALTGLIVMGWVTVTALVIVAISMPRRV